MNILLLNHEFPPLGGGGGRVCYELSRQFVQKGHRVSVVTTSFGDLPRYEQQEGIDIYRVYGCRKSALDNNVPVTSASFLFWGTRLARRLIRQQTFDLIHAYFTVPAGLAGLRLKKSTDLPLIVSPHGSDVPHHNPEKFNLPIRLLSPLIAHIWRQSNRIVTVSQGLRKTMQQTVSDLACQVIHNGIDTKHFSPSPAPKSNTPLELIAVGRLVKLKGIQDLLKAAQSLKQKRIKFRLRIAGDGDYRTQLEQQTKQNQLSDCVQFVGQVPYDQLPSFYQSADIFVLPSLAESFGQVFAEAMACGLPIIGTTTGGIPEVVGPHQQAWLVPPGNVEMLTDKLQTLIADPETQRSLGQQNASYINKHFNWSHIADAYLDQYKDVAHTPV